MARQPGSANFSGTIEALAGGPLDARNIVQNKADLTANDSFAYPYIGMETYVVSEDKKYRLIGADPTVLANWEEVISVKEMVSTDMDEIITPLPSVMSRRFKYSTDEQIVGEWINGKPVYQKTIQLEELSTATVTGSRRDFSIDLANGIADFGELVDFNGYVRYNNITTTPASAMTLNVKCTFVGTALNVNAASMMYLSGGFHFYVNKDISDKILGGVITIQYTKTTD